MAKRTKMNRKRNARKTQRRSRKQRGGVLNEGWKNPPVVLKQYDANHNSFVDHVQNFSATNMNTIKTQSDDYNDLISAKFVVGNVETNTGGWITYVYMYKK